MGMKKGGGKGGKEEKKKGGEREKKLAVMSSFLDLKKFFVSGGACGGLVRTVTSRAKQPYFSGTVA